MGHNSSPHKSTLSLFSKAKTIVSMWLQIATLFATVRHTVRHQPNSAIDNHTLIILVQSAPSFKQSTTIMESPSIQSSLPVELVPYLISGPLYFKIGAPCSNPLTSYDTGSKHEVYSESVPTTPSQSSQSSSCFAVASGVAATRVDWKKPHIACEYCRGRCYLTQQTFVWVLTWIVYRNENSMRWKKTHM